MSNIQFGLTGETPCPYLEGQSERLLVAITQSPEENRQVYPSLIEHGFRRSGDYIYRPHCAECQACESLKVDCSKFIPSRSQKRVSAKTKGLRFKWNGASSAQEYDLYERYIAERHRDGGMYPATLSSYQQLLAGNGVETAILRAFDDQQLVAVAICDVLPDGLSAVYTFFEPESIYPSLGKVMILQQIERVKQLEQAWLYLGLQVDECAKMNYKSQFRPHLRFDGHKWR
ncbi:arginyltransferase [Aliagarivorans taiwanensis]|uniref:arginyltransferase n=1 Tax=Aliagarivorans taiwanensis TaxID=561966 RepID=UPI00041454C7|nr:arginyltransferase [Aliagarivorans taiwanensis]